MKRTKATNPVPLFDKLVDLDPKRPEEIVPFRTYTNQQLKNSIQHEISIILNHRRNLTIIINNMDKIEPLLGTSLFFGTTDFSNLNFRRDTAWQLRVEDEIARSLERFEPRLKDIIVEVEGFNEQTRILTVHVSGTLFVNQVREQITFPVEVNGFAQDTEGPRIIQRQGQ